MQVAGTVPQEGSADEWLKFLQPMSRKGTVPVIVDLEQPLEAPFGEGPSTWTKEQLVRAGWTMSRQLRESEGTYLLIREGRNPGGYKSDGFFTFLRSASKEQLMEFAATGIPLNELPMDVQKSACQLLGRTGFGYARTLLLSNWDQASIKLKALPVAEFTRADGKPGQWGFHDLKEQPTPAPKSKATPSKSAATPLKPRLTGTIDFGEGQILTVLEIAEKVRKELKKGFSFDRRIQGEKLFICGRYSEEQFTKALKEATSPITPAFTVAEDRADVKSLMNGDLGEILSDHPGNSQGMSREDYVKGISTTYDQWRQANPKRADKLDHFNLPPDAKLNLKMQLGMRIQIGNGDGFHQNPHSFTTGVDGRRTHALMHNIFQIMFP